MIKYKYSLSLKFGVYQKNWLDLTLDIKGCKD